MTPAPHSAATRQPRSAGQRTSRRRAARVAWAILALNLTGGAAMALSAPDRPAAMNAAATTSLGAPASADPGPSSATAAAADTTAAGRAVDGPTAPAQTTAPSKGTSRTTSPTTASAIPGSPAGPAPAAPCALGAKLVPTCGVLWGAAPAAFDFGDRLALTRTFEAVQGRPIDVYHGYKSDGILFPSAVELSIANDPTTPRLLMINWRPDTTHTWKSVAQGGIDARIDKLAAYIKTAYNKPFFMAIWHEPEHFVNATAGSGMEATDYRDMVRHVITRLRAQGVTKVSFVQIYQGFPKFAALSWWPNLYPGDDVIDWIASDSYNSGKSTGYNSGDFNTMVNRVKANWNGFYNWATTKHPGKPLMLGEWGVFYQSTDPGRQAWFFNDVKANLAKYPALKMMSYFNAAVLDKGTTRIDASAASRDAYRSLSNSIPRIDITTAR